MTKNKIFLSPSNQTANIGAYVNTNEHEQCFKIASSAMQYLKDNYDCEVIIAEKSENMTSRTKSAEAFGANVYVAIHTNAFSDHSVHGTETYFHSSDTNGKILASSLLDSVGNLTGKKRRSKSYDSLIELNSVNCTRAYIEVEFHSNPEKAAWITESTDTIGITIGETIAKFMSLNANLKQEQSIQKPDSHDKTWVLDNIDFIFNTVKDELNK